MKRKALAIFLVLGLAGCNWVNIPLLNITPVVSPSALPQIVSPTPLFQVSLTPTGTLTFTPTGTATETPTLTLTPSPAGSLEVEIAGCNTSLDVAHGLGEVTNAYPLIRNRTGDGLTQVCATLSASDEAKKHPGKTNCTSALPAGYQVLLKVTVDTGFREDTSIRVDVTTQQGLTASAEEPSCRDLGMPGLVPGKAGLVEPIH